MKKIFGNLGFIIICVICFMVAISVGFKLRTYLITSKAYKAWQVKWDDSVGTIVKDIDLDKEKQTGYDLYIPTNLDKSKNQKLIIYMHGGGFTSGDKEDGAMKCKYYTSHGYICASINYTLMDGKHETNYNLMYEEILKSVKSIKKYFEDKNINISSMATSGDSAGSYLALLYGYRAKNDSPIPVKVVLDMTGPTTFEPKYWDITENKDIVESITRLSGKKITEDMIGTEEYENIVKEISPALLVDENTVPTVFAYGPHDKIVRTNLKYVLMDALKENNIDYTYIEFPNSGHGMLFDPDKTEEFVKVCDEYLEKYMNNN